MSPTTEMSSDKKMKPFDILIRNQYKFRFYINRSMYAKFDRLVNDLAGKLLSEYRDVSHNLSTVESRFSRQPLESDLKELYAFDKEFLANMSDLDQLMKLEFSFVFSSPADQDTKQTDFNGRRILAHFQAYVRKLLKRKNMAQINDNFLNFLPILRFDPSETYSRLNRLASTDKKVNQLVQCCREQLQSLNDVERWCLSFNGGKDCTVLLHVLVTLHRTIAPGAKPVNLLCIKTSEMFEEQSKYLERAIAYYGCRLHTYPGNDLKSALTEVRKRQSFETIFMGCRRTDFPGDIASKLTVIQRTDPGWPEFLRVNPLLDWSFTEIWSFLLALQVPYCPLYDYGYTSIDRPDNTEPNPVLKITEPVVNINDYCGEGDSCHHSIPIGNGTINDDGEIYLPAYVLSRDDLERCCRRKTDVTVTTESTATIITTSTG